MNAVLFLDRIKARITEWYRLENEASLPIMQRLEIQIGDTYKPTIDLLNDPVGIRLLGEVYRHKNLRDGNFERLAGFIRVRLIRYGYWPYLANPYLPAHQDPVFMKLVREEVSRRNRNDLWQEEELRLVILGNIVKAIAATLAELRLIESATAEPCKLDAIVSDKQDTPPKTRAEIVRSVMKGVADFEDLQKVRTLAQLLDEATFKYRPTKKTGLWRPETFSELAKKPQHPAFKRIFGPRGALARELYKKQ